MARTRIVIIGGGFGGVACARTLRRHLRRGDAEVTLFNRENHLVFSPLLADAVGSSLNLQDVIVPLRQLLPDVTCRTEEVRHVDLAARTVEFEGADGGARHLAYDHVVFACGSVANLNVVPGMADHAFPLKTVGDAAVLRTQVLQQLERAEVCEDAARRRWLCSFIVVGGGYSGVEAAGEINDLVRGSLRFYPRLQPDEVAVTLLHSRDQLLPEISPPLREFARDRMRAAGVAVRLNCRVQLATGEGVGTGDGFVRGGTIVCTIGSSPAPLLGRLDARRERGRLATEHDLRLPGRADAWAVGDCAHVRNAHDGQPSPPTGQFAERQGRQCAENIVRVLGGAPTRPFSFRVLGQLCSIGGHQAVAELLGLRLSGFLAWFVWRGVYLLKLPSWGRRIQVGADWAWLLLFPRDLAHLRTDPTERISRAHFEPGDVIIRQGDPATGFFVVEEGEVEVLRTSPDRPDGELVATLGAGNFFGEQALLHAQPRSATVRARTAVDVLVLGRNVFTTISRSLAPLRAALTAAITRRTTGSWQERPAVLAALRALDLADFIEPPPTPFVGREATLGNLTRRFARAADDVVYVAGPDGRLEGLVTFSDLLRAQARHLSPDAPVTAFMVARPAAVAATDTALVAAAAFRELGFKSLPVVADPSSRRVVGRLRAQRLLGAVLDRGTADGG